MRGLQTFNWSQSPAYIRGDILFAELEILPEIIFSGMVELLQNHPSELLKRLKTMFGEKAQSRLFGKQAKTWTLFTHMIPC